MRLDTSTSASPGPIETPLDFALAGGCSHFSSGLLDEGSGGVFEFRGGIRAMRLVSLLFLHTGCFGGQFGGGFLSDTGIDRAQFGHSLP